MSKLADLADEAGCDTRALDHHGDANVELVGFPLVVRQPELTQVVAVVRRVEQVGVVQQVLPAEDVVDVLHHVVHGQQCAESVCGGR